MITDHFNTKLFSKQNGLVSKKKLMAPMGTHTQQKRFKSCTSFLEWLTEITSKQMQTTKLNI